MRRPLIAGNWKMNCLKADGTALASGIAEKYAAATNPKCDVLVCPPALWILPVVEAVKGRIAVGAQDAHAAESGAHTGDISVPMIKDAGASYIIVGHSERRTDHHETNADVKAKAENTGKTVYFEVSPLQWGLWAAGKGTFMDELAEICGLTNAFAEVDGWGEVSEEQVLAKDPDYIVTTSMYWGEGPTPVEEVIGRAGWDQLKAVQNNQVFNADQNEITRPGPRLVDAVVSLYEFVYGTEAEEEPAA